MAKWIRASASGSVDSRFDFESGQTNHLKIGIHSFPAWGSALMGSMEKADKFACCALGKAFNEIPLCKCGKQMAGNS